MLNKKQFLFRGKTSSKLKKTERILENFDTWLSSKVENASKISLNKDSIIQFELWETQTFLENSTSN